MVFNGGAVNVVVGMVFAVWLGTVSVFLFRMIGHYNRLTQGIQKAGLREILDALLTKQYAQAETIESIKEAVKRLAYDGALHIQKIGLVRFNPFSDTGGAQSFTLALLDGHDNGLVMTSLYARTGNRWYVKEVRDGKGSELELAKEELLAIKQARTFDRKHA